MQTMLKTQEVNLESVNSFKFLQSIPMTILDKIGTLKSRVQRSVKVLDCLEQEVKLGLE